MSAAWAKCRRCEREQLMVDGLCYHCTEMVKYVRRAARLLPPNQQDKFLEEHGAALEPECPKL